MFRGIQIRKRGDIRMDREALYTYFEHHYLPKRDFFPRIPLGTDPEALWQEILNRRKEKGTTLPVYGPLGKQYWYVTTDRMIAASETIVEELMKGETVSSGLAPLEEVFYTSFVEGSPMTMQAAMEFLQNDTGPRDIEEQMILNNRNALGFAGANLFHPVDEEFMQMLAAILTQNMEGGGNTYRTTDRVDIPAMMGEPYVLPAAVSVPDRVKELTGFLAEPSVHPLIKAATAHAWVLAVRPFQEGNERLARLLSTLILHRAGYTFFGEVSLSAMIARDGYPYFDAVASILRAENEADLTYFIEYYLVLLARAVEERRRKKEQADRENIEAETALAMTPLVAVRNEPQSEPEAAVDVTESLAADGFVSFMDMGTARASDEIPWAGEKHVRRMLEQADGGSDRLISRFARLLLEYLGKGKYAFTTTEVETALGFTYTQVKGVVYSMRDKGIIEALEFAGSQKKYSFCLAQDLDGRDYSPELLKTINTMADNSQSVKDKRLGTAIRNCLDKGIVTIREYQGAADPARWDDDMRLAEQMGLVRRVTANRYFILNDIRPRFDRLGPGQKKRARMMYDSFGEETFSLEMVVATLDYSSSTASAYLHQFTLLRILDCRKEDVNVYQFLVNPREHPEVFDGAA